MPEQPTPNNGRLPSARELAQQAQQDDPWICPRCGCRDWRVISSYLSGDGARHRRRACRHCHHPIMTHERPYTG